MMKNIGQELNAKDTNESVLLYPESRAFLTFVVKHSSKKWEVVYSVVLGLTVIWVNSVLSTATLMVSRKTINEILQAGGISTLVSSIVFNFVIVCVFTWVAISVIAFVARPDMWTLVVTPHLHENKIPGASVNRYMLTLAYVFAFMISAGFMIWLITAWVKVVALTAVLPSMILVCLLVVSILLYRFREQIHTFGNRFLLKATKKKAGSLFFATSILAAAGSFIAAVSWFLKMF